MRKSSGIVTASCIIISCLAGVANAADLPSRKAPLFAAPEEKEHWLWLTGINAERNSIVGYFAGIHSVRSGLFDSGWRVRIGGALGHYSYAPPAGGRTGVDFQQFDALLGYHFKLGRGGFTFYLGGEYQNHDNPDPFARVRGTAGGVKVLVDYYQPIGDRFNFFAFGSYSTAFSTYIGVAQLGYRLDDRFTVGPEVSGSGNLSHDKARVGGFIDYRVGKVHAINVSAGWSEMLRNGPAGRGSSPYVQGQFTLRF